MKTTENISLAGYAFTIETDAYEELDNYITSIKQCFSSDSSADEITSDIEERIAELLSEKCCNGSVANLKMIMEIKERIGDPKDLSGMDYQQTGEDDSETRKEEKKSFRNRKLYRNIDERVLGGVCSGLGNYFGLEKVLFRILFLIFFFIGFADEGLFCISLVIYLGLWIAMPAARTVEQKCEMYDKPINLKGFRDKDFNLKTEVHEAATSPAVRTIRRAGSLIIGISLLVLGICGLLGCIFIPSLPSLISNNIPSDYNYFDFGERVTIEIVTSSTFWGLVLTAMVTCFIGMLYGGIMLSFDLKSPSWKPGLIIFISWVVSILVLAAWVLKIVADALPTVEL